MQVKQLDRNRAAAAIKAAMVLKNKRQGDVARAVGITRQELNAFVNRRLDLMPETIEQLAAEVGITGLLSILSAGVD